MYEYVYRFTTHEAQRPRSAAIARGAQFELDSIDGTKALRDQCDLDSVDFFNFIVAIHAATGVEITEVDYPKVATLDDCVAYIQPKVGTD